MFIRVNSEQFGILASQRNSHLIQVSLPPLFELMYFCLKWNLRRERFLFFPKKLRRENPVACLQGFAWSGLKWGIPQKSIQSTKIRNIPLHRHFRVRLLKLFNVFTFPPWPPLPYRWGSRSDCLHFCSWYLDGSVSTLIDNRSPWKNNKQ